MIVQMRIEADERLSAFLHWSTRNSSGRTKCGLWKLRASVRYADAPPFGKQGDQRLMALHSFD